jgi:hypothetical protein
LPKARVAAWALGQFLEVGTTDGNGIVHLPIHPTASGDFLLTVTAYDAHPLEASVPIVEPPTPTLAALVSAEARLDRVVLRGQTSVAGAAFSLERARDTGAWTTIAELRADGTGLIQFEDLGVEPGATYRYRLAGGEAGGPGYSAALAVTMPRRPVLALRLRGAQPVAGAPELEMTLGSSAPARLELLDVTGRRLISRDLLGLGIGAHVVRLDDAASLAPGLYWLRLAQDGRSAGSRMVVAR